MARGKARAEVHSHTASRRTRRKKAEEPGSKDEEAPVYIRARWNKGGVKKHKDTPRSRRYKELGIDGPHAWLILDRQGLEITVHMDAPELRSLHAEITTILTEIDAVLADPPACTDPECWECKPD